MFNCLVGDESYRNIHIIKKHCISFCSAQVILYHIANSPIIFFVVCVNTMFICRASVTLKRRGNTFDPAHAVRPSCTFVGSLSMLYIYIYTKTLAHRARCQIKWNENEIVIKRRLGLNASTAATGWCISRLVSQKNRAWEMRSAEQRIGLWS